MSSSAAMRTNGGVAAASAARRDDAHRSDANSTGTARKHHRQGAAMPPDDSTALGATQTDTDPTRNQNDGSSATNDDDALATFLAVTGTTDSVRALATLQRFDGNLERAVAFALDGTGQPQSSSSTGSTNRRSPPQPDTTASIADTFASGTVPRSSIARRSPQPNSTLPRTSFLSLLLWPLDAVLSTAIAPLLRAILALLPSPIALFLRGVLPHPTLSVTDSQKVTRIRTEADSKTATLDLIRRLDTISTTSLSSSANPTQSPFKLPVLSKVGYRKAAYDCGEELTYLLVYLHCDLKGKPSYDFCSNHLPKLITELHAMNERPDSVKVNLWVADIMRSSQASELADTLGSTTYPFFAVLLPESGSKLSVAARCVAPTSYEEVMSVVVKCKSKWDAKLRQRKRDQQAQNFARTLREEQNGAYERSLELDRQKEAEKRRKEAEKAEQEAKELEREKAHRKKVEERKAQFARLRDLVPEEPTNNTTDCVLIKVSLPTSKRIQRKFLKAHTMRDLYNFVRSLPEEDLISGLDNEDSEINIVQSYPRKVLPTDDTTLADAGFGRGGVVIVEEDILVDDK